MPIYDQAYSGWDGAFLEKPKPWWVLARMHIALLFKKWVIVFLIFSSIQFIIRIIQIIINNYKINQIVTDEIARQLEINGKFFYDFLNIQFFGMILMVVIIGAALIAKDRIFNALPLYFSKPLGFYNYLCGKGLVVSFYMALITVIPALLLFLTQLAIGSDTAFISDYFWVPFSLIGIWIVGALLFGGLILAMSSVMNSIGASILFFGGIWFAEMIRKIFSRIPEVGLFSVRALYKQISAWMFGQELPYEFSIWAAWISFAAIVGACFFILRWRIRPTEVVR